MDDFHQLRLGARDSTFPRDVGTSEVGPRRALARCRVLMSSETTASVAANTINKGDVLSTARVAGIQAAKRAQDLLPMAHPVLVGNTYINFMISDTFIEIEASVDTVGPHRGDNGGHDRRFRSPPSRFTTCASPSIP